MSMAESTSKSASGPGVSGVASTTQTPGGGTATLLPLGAYVMVSEPFVDGRVYRAVVRGYDLYRSKYHLGERYGVGLFSKGGAWAFPSWCTEITETEANRGDQP